MRQGRRDEMEQAINRAIGNTESAGASRAPLCVGLERTLLRGTSAGEVLIQLLRANPAALLMTPIWALKGREHLASQAAARVNVDAAAFAYDEGLVDRLRQLAAKRQIVLCTRADADVAQVVAAHLGLFDGVIATTRAGINAGARKREAIARHFGESGIEYVGNEPGDLPAQRVAAWPLGSDLAAQRRSSLGEWVKAIRIEQWAKNVLLFVPLLAAHQFSNWHAWFQALLAFLAFGLCASSHYIVNDLRDLQVDRNHPRKKMRMFASGAVSVSAGLIASPLLLLAAAIIAVWIGWPFAALLAAYFVATNLYTFWLKRVPILDALVLAGLYTLRILAGAAAVEVVPSFWLLAFSMFFFLSLALAKRHSEMGELGGANGYSVLPGRGYRQEDDITLISQGAASGYAAVLVLAFFINSEEVKAQYSHPEVIWLVCPLLLYWVNKLWLNSQRREILEDPVVWALTNRVSRAIFILCGVLVIAAI